MNSHQKEFGFRAHHHYHVESFEKFLVQVLCAKPLSLNIHISELRVKLKHVANLYTIQHGVPFIHGYFTALNTIADIFD